MHRASYALSCCAALLALTFVACHNGPPKPAVVPRAAPSSAVVAAPSPPPPSRPAPPAAERSPWDFEHVHRVTVTKNQGGPAGDKPAKDKRLREVSRFPWPLAPSLGLTMPQGASIPRSFEGAAERSNHLSNGKLLIAYGSSHLVVVDYANGMVEHALNLDSADVPLTANERQTDNMGLSAYANGVVFVCRDWNERFPARAGYVDAIDLATGALRWRSVAQACSGGTAGALGDYVLVSNGGTLKLLRAYDGVVVQQLVNLGNINDIRVEGPRAIVETTKWGLEYELR